MYVRKKARGRLDKHLNGLCVCAHEVPPDVGYGVGREESPSYELSAGPWFFNSVFVSRIISIL